MDKSIWNSFPFPAAEYDFAGAALEQHWGRLHQSDREPYPAAAGLDKLVARHPALEPPMSLENASTTLQDAWRAYHRGDFAAAVALGLSVGRLGYNVANKAQNMYALHVESAHKRKLAMFRETAERAEELQGYAPSVPNAWYLHAHALGSYGQGLSVAQVLAENLGGRIKESLDRTVALEPRHADAHLGLGAYHAEIIDKVGGFIAGFTHGVSTDAGMDHFARALELNPHSPIARMVQADSLEKMFGGAKKKKARRLYEEAAACEPADAMERLAVEVARRMKRPSP